MGHVKQLEEDTSVWIFWSPFNASSWGFLDEWGQEGMDVFSVQKGSHP